MSMTLPRAVPRGRQGPPGPAGANGTTTATGSTGTFTVNGDASDAELALVAKRQGSDYNNSIITFTAPRGDTADNGISANRGAVVLPGRSNVNNSSLFIVVNTANIVESDTYADFQNYGGAIELSTDSSSLFRLWRTDTNYFEVDPSAAYRNGNKIWDAGNDGAGSGLDADLLDGKHGSEFFILGIPSDFWATGSQTHYCGIGPDNNRLGFIGSNGAHTVCMYSNGYRNDSGGLTIIGAGGHTATASGIECSPNGTVIIRGGAASGTTIQETAEISQTVFEYKNNDIYHAGNDGAGSGLDADLLDGNQASYFQVASDERIKDDIRQLEPVMDRLLQIDMKRFKITDETWSHVPTIGVIAQQLEQLFPEFVYEQNGRKLVHYGPLASVAIQGLQELNARMERIERLLHNDTES